METKDNYFFKELAKRERAERGSSSVRMFVFIFYNMYNCLLLYNYARVLKGFLDIRTAK